MALLKLIRWKNLLIILMVQLAVYSILLRVFSANDSVYMMDFWTAICLIFMTLSSAAGGYIINDVYDVEADQINRADQLIVTKEMKIQEARWYYGATIFDGAIAIFIAYKLSGDISYILLYILVVFTLWVYAKYLKKTPGMGNIFVSVLCGGSVILMAWPIIFFSIYTEAWITNLAGQVWALASFSFAVTLCRELAKDIEDISGDQIIEASTIPIVIGFSKAKTLLLFLVIASILGILTYFIANISGQNKYVLLLGLPMGTLILTLFYIWKSKSSDDYHLISKYLKVTMIFGLLAFWVFIN